MLYRSVSYGPEALNLQFFTQLLKKEGLWPLRNRPVKLVAESSLKNINYYLAPVMVEHFTIWMVVTKHGLLSIPHILFLKVYNRLTLTIEKNTIPENLY